MTGKKVTEFRNEMRLSREAFAQKIGYSASYLKDIETGRVKPSRRFLEAVSREFNMSIDALLSKSLILDAIDARRGTKNPDIVFLYAFRQRDLDTIEEILRLILADRKLIIVDAASFTNFKQVYSKILNREWKSWEDQDEIKEMLVYDEIMLVIKNISLSKIQKIWKAAIIRDLFKIIDDDWIRTWRSGKKPVIPIPKSSVIVLDFPSFLENFYETIGEYTAPIYPRSDIDSFMRG